MSIRKHVSKKGEVSYYVYVSVGGKPQYVGKRRIKDEAKKLENAEKAKRDKRGPNAADAPETLAGLWEALSPSLSARSLTTYSESWKRVEPVLGKVKLTRLSSVDIDKLINKLSEDYAPSTVVLGVRVISILWNKASHPDLGWVSGKNPTWKKTKGLVRSHDQIDITKLDSEADAEDVRFADADQVAAVLRAADGWVRDLIAFGVFAGARLGEACAVCWQDISWSRNQITIRRSVKGLTKSGKRRHLPIQRQLRPVLERRHLAAGRPKKGRVFPELASVKDEAAKARNAIYQARDAAGLEGLTTHELFRHTFASLFLGGGGDLFSLAKYLGHRDPKLTFAVYSHLIPSAFEKDANRIQLPNWESDERAEVIQLLATDDE